MSLIANVESARWVEPATGLLLITGWALQRDGQPFEAVRVKVGTLILNGYYGIRRPDVAQAHGFGKVSVFCGFSLLLRVPAGTSTFRIEVRNSSDSWECLEEINLSQRAQVAPAELRPAESEGWDAAPGERTASRPVLFIGHDFAAAGAQLILLRQLHWLKARSAVPFETLLAVPRSATVNASESERAVLADYHAAGTVHFLSDLTQAPENLAAIRGNRYRLIYVNTATLGWLLPGLRPFSCPVITHVHELAFWLTKRTGLHVLARQVAETDHFIACSTPVRDCLVQLAGVDSTNISVVHDCGSLARAHRTREEHDRDSVRRELGIPQNALVVAACGTFDWRKGAELFVPICVATRRLIGSTREFHAYWIGAYGERLVLEQFEHEVSAAGLDGRVRLLGPRSDPLRLMLAADCLALTSREDPFPIVMLEAGTLGLPVVGFQGSGGVTEFVADQAGLVVPYLDVESFAAALATLANDPEQRLRLGKGAFTRATQLFDEEKSFQRIRALINERSPG